MIFRRWICVAFSLALSTVCVAQENCGYRASLLLSGFERGEQPSLAVLPAQNTPLTLVLTWPPEGAVLGTRRLQVRGTLTGPANVGVVVNGQELAMTNATAFTSQLFLLEPGAQTLTVTATTVDGQTQTVSRNLTISPELGEDVFFIGRTAGNYAPMRIGFELKTRPPAGQNQVVRIQIDYNGDGQFEVDAVQPPATLAYDYDLAGTYLARARVSFDDGDNLTALVIRESTFQVHMDLLAYTRETLCQHYYEMKHRLQANAPAQALLSLSPQIRPQFQAFWADIGAQLPTVAGQLGEIVRGQISDVSADLVVALPDSQRPGEYLGFPLLFSRGADGVWRISGM